MEFEQWEQGNLTREQQNLNNGNYGNFTREQQILTRVNKGTTEFDMGTMEIEQGKISNAPFGFYRSQGMILMGACLLLFVEV